MSFKPDLWMLLTVGADMEGLAVRIGDADAARSSMCDSEWKTRL